MMHSTIFGSNREYTRPRCASSLHGNNDTGCLAPLKFTLVGTSIDKRAYAIQNAPRLHTATPATAFSALRQNASERIAATTTSLKEDHSHHANVQRRFGRRTR